MVASRGSNNALPSTLQLSLLCTAIWPCPGDNGHVFPNRSFPEKVLFDPTWSMSTYGSVIVSQRMGCCDWSSLDTLSTLWLKVDWILHTAQNKVPTERRSLEWCTAHRTCSLQLFSLGFLTCNMGIEYFHPTTIVRLSLINYCKIYP